MRAMLEVGDKGVEEVSGSMGGKGFARFRKRQPWK